MLSGPAGSCEAITGGRSEFAISRRGSGFLPVYQLPIHWAAQSGNVEIVQTIVKAGGYPFDLDTKGRYAWICAIAGSGKKRYDIMKYLLDLGQPANWKLRDGSVPFVDILIKDDPELIQLFLDHGLKLEMEHQGRTLLEIAEQIGSKANLAVIHRFLNKT
jgi:ankyrin repeat protein